VVLACSTVAGCAAALRPVDAPERAITVSGRGEVLARPDTAIVRLGAEARRQTLAEATADVTQRMTAVLERVRALGVRPEDVTTVHYAVEPLAIRGPEGTGDPARISGYRVSNVVQLRVRDLSAVSRVVDAAVAAGANVIQGVHFTLDDRRPAETTARERAVAAAHATALELARAAGVRLGPLVSLSEAGGVRPGERTAMMAGVQRSTAGPIEAGELTVLVFVEARYGIEPATPR
jgi:uncharacterized protein YggE